MITLNKYVKISVNFAVRGLDALRDVTDLSNRSKQHADRKSLDFKRTSLRCISREPFLQLSAVQQEAFIYRLQA